MMRSAAALGLCILNCFTMSPAVAVGLDDAAFENASAAAQSGRLEDMQIAYEEILQQSPDNVRALNGKATAMAWQANYRDAQATYEKALAVDVRNVDALVGLGYAYAWDGQFGKAHTQFQHALRIDPINIDARKGIAYSFHWQGSNELALGAFQTVASLEPNNAELEEAIGKVNYALGRKRDAVSHFNRAVMLDPDRTSATFAKRAAYLSAPALEVSSSFGTTSDAGSGLRRLEFAHWPSEATRFAIRYDNSLGLDNASLSNRGVDAPGYFGSIHKTFRERFTLGVEIGSRDLVDNRQIVIGLQGTYFAPFGALKFGTQQGLTNGDLIDKVVFGGVNFPLSQRWRAEPMLYLSETGADNDREWRAVVGIDYQPDSAWQVGAFLGRGKVDARDMLFSGDTTSAGLRGNYLWADKYSFNWSVRREVAPTASFSVAEIGFTYRLISN